MSTGPINELTVAYDPAELADKVERWRRLTRSRVTSLIITLVIMTVIYFWQRDQLQGAGFIAIYGVVLAISVAILLVTLFGYRRLRAQLREVGTGPAIRIGTPGIQVAELGAPWSQVSALTTEKGRLGRAPGLKLALTDGRSTVLPLDTVAVYPATIDSTVRAFSGGRLGVDLSALET